MNIYLSTLKLNNQIPAKSKPTAIGDYNHNRTPDLMVKFNRRSVQNILSAGDRVKITISGQLKDKRLFEGSDTIKVISNGKPTSFLWGVFDFIQKSTNKLLGLVM